MKRKSRWLEIIFSLGILFWGIYTSLIYLGVGERVRVLLSDDHYREIISKCADAWMCRGTNSLWYLITDGIMRAKSFWGFFAVSFLIYFVISVWTFIKNGSARLRIRVRPLLILFSFILLAIILFVSIGGLEVRRLVRPVNDGHDPVVYAILDREFKRSEQKGCLEYAGLRPEGGGVYQVKNGCAYTSFLGLFVPSVLFVCGFLFELLVLGRALLGWFKLYVDTRAELLLSLGLGAGAWISLLWGMAIINLYQEWIGWVFVIGIPVICWRSAAYWIRWSWSSRRDIEIKLLDCKLFLGWILVSILALNFLGVMRPFPVGWDDIGSYLSRPRQLVFYGRFISVMAPFQWEYLTSLGFLLFGPLSQYGAMFSLLTNWTGGLISILAVWVFAREFLGRGGLLSASLFYLLPMVQFFSFSDLKTDTAVFAMGVMSVFCVFFGLFKAGEKKKVHRWMLLGGVLSGFALSMKATTVLAIISLGSVIGGVILGVGGFVGMMMLGVAGLIRTGALNIWEFINRLTGRGVEVMTMPVIVGLVFLAGIFVVIGGWKVKRFGEFCWLSGMFGVGIVVVVMPWIVNSNLRGLGGVASLTSSVNTEVPMVNIWGWTNTLPGVKVSVLPKELAVDLTSSACQLTSRKEELGRYSGDTGGVGYFLGMPFRVAMNADVEGYYVTTSVSWLWFPLLFAWVFFWKRESSWLRWLSICTLVIVGLWVVVSLGVPWYGMVMFLGFSVGIEAMMSGFEKRWQKRWLGFILILSFWVMVVLRVNEFERQKGLMAFQTGAISAAGLLDGTFPGVREIERITTERHKLLPKTPYVYRVGTMVPYFIPKNLEIFGVDDSLMDIFSCIHGEGSDELALKRLKALGFNSVLFDLNTATIEKDPNGSLHRKAVTMVNFLNNKELGMKVAVHDKTTGVALVLLP